MLMPRMTDAWMGRVGITWPKAPWSRGKIDARVAEQTAASGYLVGASFSIADLTAASLLMPLAYPKGVQPPPPEPRSEWIRGWIARWEGHPGTAWVREMYRLHRRVRPPHVLDTAPCSVEAFHAPHPLRRVGGRA